MRRLHCVTLTAILFQELDDQNLLKVYEKYYHIANLIQVRWILKIADYHLLLGLLVSYPSLLIEIYKTRIRRFRKIPYICSVLDYKIYLFIPCLFILYHINKNHSQCPIWYLFRYGKINVLTSNIIVIIQIELLMPLRNTEFDLRSFILVVNKI